MKKVIYVLAVLLLFLCSGCKSITVPDSQPEERIITETAQQVENVKPPYKYIEYTVRYIDGYKNIIITSETDDELITVSIGAGMKSTSIVHLTESTYDVYISERSKNYIEIPEDINDEYIYSMLDYENDKYIGTYDMDETSK